MYINRLAETQLRSYLSSDKIIIILGARQVGKTTLIKHLSGAYKTTYLNLDIEADKARLISLSHISPSDALKNLNTTQLLIIDEAQRLPETARIIKGWYDSSLPIKTILLGSSSLNLLDQSAENLTGRNVKLFLPPLTVQEILQTQQWFSATLPDSAIESEFNNSWQTFLLDRMVYGSYPEAVTTDDKQQYLLNLVNDYLLKDVFQSALLRSGEQIKQLLLHLAYQTGSLVSVNELARSIGVSRITINRYIDLLEKTFVIFKLPAYSTNMRNEIMRSSKIYFWDTGIRNALLNDFSLSAQRIDLGQLWENWIIAEFAKTNLLNGQLSNLYHWRSKYGGEVDLIIKGANGMSAYEVKLTKKAPGNVRNFEERYNMSVKVINRSSYQTLIQSLSSLSR